MALSHGWYALISREQSDGSTATRLTFPACALAGPIGTKTRCPADFDERFAVSYFHRSPAPLMGSDVHQFRPGPV